MLYQKIELPRFSMRRHLSIWPLNISSPTITEMSSSSKSWLEIFLTAEDVSFLVGSKGMPTRENF